MNIIPVKKGGIYSVELSFKDQEKIEENIYDENLLESDIDANSEKFSNSSFSKSILDSAPTDFIRSRSIYYQRKIKVSTHSRRDSKNYDVYLVAYPPKKINDGLDSLYGRAITNLRKEIPDSPAKGRYISLDKFGLNEIFTDEVVDKMKEIVEKEEDFSRWPELFMKAGIPDLHEEIEFLNIFDFTVLSNKPLPEKSLNDTIEALGVINSRDHRRLAKYAAMAESNSQILSNISYIKKVYERPQTLVRDNDKAKQFVKKEHETYQQAA